MTQQLTATLFQPHIGSEFKISNADIPLSLTLENVDTVLDDKSQYAFSLVFRGAPEVYIPQQICSLSHPVLGDHMLLLVPIAQDEQGYRYEAAISLMKEEA